MIVDEIYNSYKQPTLKEEDHDCERTVKTKRTWINDEYLKLPEKARRTID